MKIRIDIDNSLVEDEIIIRCKKLNKNISRIQQSVMDLSSSTLKLLFFKEDKEYYIPIEDILFFETSESDIYAHTTDDVYKVKYRLYALSEVLPSNFVRISKSTILNVNKIFSITRNITSSNLVQFYKSHKQVYVSRFYYKELRRKLEERINYEK